MGKGDGSKNVRNADAIDKKDNQNLAKQANERAALIEKMKNKTQEKG